MKKSILLSLACLLIGSVLGSALPHLVSTPAYAQHPSGVGTPPKVPTRKVSNVKRDLWEYRCDVLRKSFNAQNPQFFEKKLNELGVQGWEYAFPYKDLFCFKRLK